MAISTQYLGTELWCMGAGDLGPGPSGLRQCSSVLWAWGRGSVQAQVRVGLPGHLGTGSSQNRHLSPGGGRMFWQWSHPLVGGGAGWLLWEVGSWPLNFQEEVCSQEHPSPPPFHPPCDPKPPGRTNSSMFGQLAPHPGQPSGLSVSHARNSREGLGGWWRRAPCHRGPAKRKA